MENAIILSYVKAYYFLHVTTDKDMMADELHPSKRWQALTRYCMDGSRWLEIDQQVQPQWRILFPRSG